MSYKIFPLHITNPSLYLCAVVGIRLSGRETRSNEPFVSSLKDLVKQVSEEIMQHYNDKPMAFFGHR